MRKIMLLLLLIGTIHSSNGQMYGNVWCFGDSVMMKFDAFNNITFDSCVTNNYEPSASISDSAGNLLMYLVLNDSHPFGGAKIYNKQHNMIFGADSLYSSLYGSSSALILQQPGNNSHYFIFHTTNYVSFYNELYWSEIDISANGGNGGLTSKNNLLSFINDTVFDAIGVVKHANGRDWWVVSHTLKTNVYYFYLLSPNGIAFHHAQSLGSMFLTSTPGYTGSIKFSLNGEKLIAVNMSGVIDLFDFDRCSGILSNWINYDSVRNSAYEFYLSCSFSSNAEKAYVSSPKRIWQINLMDTSMSMGLVYTNNNPDMEIGYQIIGLDGKIYISNSMDLSPNFPFRDTINTHLSVINYPDSLGALCGFQPYAQQLYIGRKGKTRGSMPNIPNYNLKNLVGSPCDTVLTSVNESLGKNEMFTIYPNPGSDFVTLKLLNTDVKVIGVKILNDLSQCITTIFDYDLIDVKFLNNGLYIFEITTNKGVYYAKFVKE